ncbi:MAG: hypothetical protein JNK82_24025 [Myxococcaceae bacterium]|nr:hypothetical protein [Myxococcaceae bacterium]
MKALLYASAALNVYVLAAMLVFALYSYPQFEQSVATYAQFNRTIGFAVVPWEFLAFIVPLALYATKPQPLSAVHALTALGVIYFVITFSWHLPAHRPLAAGEAGDTQVLMASQWARTAVQVARAALAAGLAVHASG